MKLAPFHIKLSDPRGKKPAWFLQLDGGFSGSGIDFLSDDTNNIYIRNVGKKIGDFDEQRDWKGGRGGEFLSDDPSKYRDSLNCWTLSSGHVTQGLLWQIATGYRSALTSLPGTSKSLSWQALVAGSGNSLYVASVALGALTSADKAKLWIRRVGTPGTLTLEIRAASGGAPNGAVRVSKTVTTTDVTDVISVFQTFDWTSTQNITAGDYLVVYGASTDSLANHWEVGVDRATTSSVYSASGTGTWTSATFSLYYHITDADTAQRFFFYTDGTTFYAVSKKDSGNSQVFSINSSAVLTELTTTGLGTVTGRPVIANGVHYYPQGESTAIRRYNGSAWRGESSNYATFLTIGYDQSDGPVLWKANSTPGLVGPVGVSRANLLASGVPITWAADSTNGLTFKTAIPIGSTTQGINGIYFWINSGLYVFKADSVWSVSKDSPTFLDYGLASTPSAVNGTFALGSQQFLFFPWLFSLERLYSGQLDDIGQGWKGPALPNGREGSYAAGCSYVSFQFYAMDAGASGTSSVVCYDGVSWHEVFRAPAVGMRIRDVAIQPISGARSKLWVDCGGDLFYMILPLSKARPIDDPSVMYQHEGVLYSSTIDMGAASKLPKLIQELTANAANLNGAGRRIDVQYQVDDKIGLDGYANWISIPPFLISPESTVKVNAANIRQFAYRLILRTDTNTTPVDLKGIVPTGLARGKTKTVWSLRVKGDSITSGGRTTDPNELLKYLMEAQESPGTVIMNSDNPLFDNYYVELSLQHIQPITDKKSVFNLTLVGV